MRLKRIIFSKELLFRLAALTLLLIGIFFQTGKFFWILGSGLILGIYYGYYNDIIWRPTGKLYPLFPYRAHQLWIHVVCGLVSSTCLYFLLGVININDQATTLTKLGLREFVLLVIALLGYVGLLPRIIWFFSYAQSIFSKGG